MISSESFTPNAQYGVRSGYLAQLTPSQASTIPLPQPLTPDTFPILQCDPDSLTGHQWNPQQALQAGVLLQCLSDLQYPGYPYSPRAKRIVREAIEWVEGDDPEWIFSSGPVCDSLGIDIHALRDQFHAIVTQRDLMAPATVQPASKYGTLVTKLLTQIRQPEAFLCDSKAEARKLRNRLTFCIRRMLDNQGHYSFHTRVVGPQVTCWIEEIGKKHCTYCEAIVMQDQRVCRLHLREPIARRKHRKKGNV